MTIKEAILIHWDDMPIEFFSIDLIKFVRYSCGRPKLFDGSILRKMRELKQKNEIDFFCISHSKSQYRKIPTLTNINKSW